MNQNYLPWKVINYKGQVFEETKGVTYEDDLLMTLNC